MRADETLSRASLYGVLRTAWCSTHLPNPLHHSRPPHSPYGVRTPYSVRTCVRCSPGTFPRIYIRSGTYPTTDRVGRVGRVGSTGYMYKQPMYSVQLYYLRSTPIHPSTPPYFPPPPPLFTDTECVASSLVPEPASGVEYRRLCAFLCLCPSHPHILTSFERAPSIHPSIHDSTSPSLFSSNKLRPGPPSSRRSFLLLFFIPFLSLPCPSLPGPARRLPT